MPFIWPLLLDTAVCVLYLYIRSLFMIHDLRALVDSTHCSSLLHRKADSVSSMLYIHPSAETAYPP